MRLGDPLADGEAESGARTLARARARGVGAPEAIEHVRQVTWGDADTGVRDSEHGASVMAAELDGDLAAARRVLHRVLDQVEGELAETAPIDGYDNRLRRQADLHSDPRVLGEQLAGLSRLPKDFPQIHRLAM